MTTGTEHPKYRHDVTAEIVLELWEQEVPLTQIAKKLDCSVDTVKARLWSAGVTNCDLFHKGYIKRWNGYIKVRRPEHIRADSKGYVGEHIVVAEHHIGRCLADNEVVHHIDHDRQNNEIENLKVMDRDEHRSMHSKMPRKSSGKI